MIFLTVGSQLQFDRLTRSVDLWASQNPDVEVFAQIGISKYKPRNMIYCSELEPKEYKDKLESADFLVSHAGMGTIISALEIGKPILIMPRKASMRETRNDHQFSTAKHFKKYSSIEVADNEERINEKLDYMLHKIKQEVIRSDNIEVSVKLINKIKEFINL